MAATEKRANIAPIGFPDTVHENRARAEWPFEIALIYLDACIIDDTYQRPAQQVFVQQMIENFDETLVGCISINERKNGKLAILDGQQRYLAMTAKSKTSCYASVYRGMSLKDEAGFFYRMNKDRKSMNIYYGFRARRVAGDPVTAAISEIVEGQGFTLGPVANDTEVIGAIASVEKAYGVVSDLRDDCLGIALATLRESVYGRKGSLEAFLIQGLAIFWSVTPDDDVDVKLLKDIISDYGPAGLREMVREKQMMNPGRRNFSLLLGLVLAQRYNAAARGSGVKKLDIKRYE
jgi:hypothetical protein